MKLKRTWSQEVDLVRGEMTRRHGANKTTVCMKSGCFNPGLPQRTCYFGEPKPCNCCDDCAYECAMS